jgi:hypothetical protein
MGGYMSRTAKVSINYDSANSEPGFLEISNDCSDKNIVITLFNPSREIIINIKDLADTLRYVSKE